MINSMNGKFRNRSLRIIDRQEAAETETAGLRISINFVEGKEDYWWLQVHFHIGSFTNFRLKMDVRLLNSSAILPGGDR